MTSAPVTSSAPVGDYAGYIFDLDGTIYLGDDALPGAVELIHRLNQRGALVRFVSNNATKSPEQYLSKLTGLGIEVSLDQIVNPIVTAVDWLRTHHRGQVVFPIAEAPVMDALTASGISLSDDPAEIDVVLASYDRGFDYRKLQIAFDTLWFHRRGILVQTNPDRYCPFPGGRGEPDCAAITAAIEACTQVSCSQNLGKPDPVMVTAALRGIDIDPAQVLMVGDRLGTDIAMGTAAGLATCLVLTGDSTAAEAAALPAAQRPHHVVTGVADLLS